MRKLFVVISITSLFLSACMDKNSSGGFKPASAGKVFEMVMIVNNQYWNSSIGDSLNNLFKQAVPALPQPEPMFDILRIDHDAFSNLFKKHRNILNVRISPYVDSIGVTIVKDKWASPQIYVELMAHTQYQFDSLMQKKGKAILQLFQNEEMNRLSNAFLKMENQEVFREMLNKHHVIIHVPGQFSLDVDRPNFQWISHETPKLTQSLLVWEYPYTNEQQLNLQYIILAHDSVLLKNVPGEEKDSYMAIEKRWKPEFNVSTKKGYYTAELKGLWEVEGDFMGGPFVSYTMVDTLRSRLVTFMGFVYAGKQNKRNYIRELEAIMKSADLAKKKE